VTTLLAPTPWVALVGVVICAILLVRIPRALFTEAAEQKPSRRLEAALVLVIACAGLAAYFSGLGRTVEGRFAFSLAIMTFAGVVYSDISFLVIPDLYSAVLVGLSFLAPWKYAPQEALLGLFVCGGLLAVLSFLWHRFTNVEGLGFGDVKLAAAMGALLSAQPGLFAISASAAGALVLALIFKGLRRTSPDEPPLVPYGAALALASAAFLAKGMG
jgi:leader peptidase (prepilin peptidase)/N-methyltransferase